MNGRLSYTFAKDANIKMHLQPMNDMILHSNPLGVPFHEQRFTDKFINTGGLKTMRQETRTRPTHRDKNTRSERSERPERQVRKSLSERSKARLAPKKTEEKQGRKKPIPADKQLKVIGHQLKPCIIISESSVTEEGLSESIIKEAKARLNDHELIKVKLRFLDRDERHEVLQFLIAETGARTVHVIGKVALILKASSRFSEKKSNIERFRQLV